MKKIIVAFLAFVFLSIQVYAQLEVGGSSDGKPSPKIWMETNIFQFGKIPFGIPVSTTFTLKNSGNAPLSLTKVEAACNCTLVDYTKEEIQPGDSGFVKATYDAQMLGVFDKRIFVYSNAYEGEMDLILKGEVIYVSEK